jgi:hypothetical protein
MTDKKISSIGSVTMLAEKNETNRGGMGAKAED